MTCPSISGGNISVHRTSPRLRQLRSPLKFPDIPDKDPRKPRPRGFLHASPPLDFLIKSDMMISSYTFEKYHEWRGFMQDGYGREIDYLRLSVTDLCNYRCVYCMGPEGLPNDLTRTSSLLRSAWKSAGLLLRAASEKSASPGRTVGAPGNSWSCAEGCGKSPGLAELCLTTNGSRLEELAAPLRQAGVDRLNISLDTLRPERFFLPHPPGPSFGCPPWHRGGGRGWFSGSETGHGSHGRLQ